MRENLDVRTMTSPFGATAFTVPLTLNFLLSRETRRNLWIEVTRPWFPLQVHSEHWKCVNRRLPCRDVI